MMPSTPASTASCASAGARMPCAVGEVVDVAGMVSDAPHRREAIASEDWLLCEALIFLICPMYTCTQQCADARQAGTGQCRARNLQSLTFTTMGSFVTLLSHAMNSHVTDGSICARIIRNSAVRAVDVNLTRRQGRSFTPAAGRCLLWPQHHTLCGHPRRH